jgi:hypothetical protein
MRFTPCDGIREEELGWNIISDMVSKFLFLHPNSHNRDYIQVDHLRKCFICLFPSPHVGEEAAGARGAEWNEMEGDEARGDGDRGSKAVFVMSAHKDKHNHMTISEASEAVNTLDTLWGLELARLLGVD